MSDELRDRVARALCDEDDWSSSWRRVAYRRAADAAVPVVRDRERRALALGLCDGGLPYWCAAAEAIGTEMLRALLRDGLIDRNGEDYYTTDEGRREIVRLAKGKP